MAAAPGAGHVINTDNSGVALHRHCHSSGGGGGGKS